MGPSDPAVPWGSSSRVCELRPSAFGSGLAASRDVHPSSRPPVCSLVPRFWVPAPTLAQAVSAVLCLGTEAGKGAPRPQQVPVAPGSGLRGQSGFLLQSGRLLMFRMLGIVLRDFTSEEGYVHSRQLCNTTGSGALKLLYFAGRSEFLMTPWLCQRRRWPGCPQSLLGQCLLGGALPSSSSCWGP